MRIAKRTYFVTIAALIALIAALFLAVPNRAFALSEEMLEGVEIESADGTGEQNDVVTDADVDEEFISDGNIGSDTAPDGMENGAVGNDESEDELQDSVEPAIGEGDGDNDSVVDGVASNADKEDQNIPEGDVESSAKSVASNLRSQAPGVLVIAIDPGHGGTDGGASGNGYTEKYLTLSIAEAMKAELEKYQGVKVVLTRTGDYYVGLSERVTIAENAGASVFISIHINSGGGTGFEVWAPTQSSNYNLSQRNQAWALSDKVLANLVSAYGLANRGVKSRESTSGDTYADGSTSDYFTVIDGSRRAGMIGILIEHGFIDNSTDANKLYTGSNPARMGQLDAKAVADQFQLSTEECPNVTATVVGSGSVKLSWQKIAGATRYAIALRNADDTYKTYTYDCTDTTYTITGLTNGYKYTFLVQAYMKDHWTSYAEYHHVTIAVTETPKTSATPGIGSAKLSWNAISGASKYAIAVRNSDGTYKTYTYDCKATSYTVNGLTAGQKYQFIVQAYYPGGGLWSTFTNSDLVSVTPTGVSKPAPKASAVSASAVKLTWDAVTNATKYAIATKNGNGFKNYSIECKATSFTVTGLNEGTTYQFLVQGYVNGKWTSFTNADLVSFKVTDPTAPSVTAKATGDGTVSLTWGKISGATKYAVAEKLADGSYKTFTYNCADGSFTVSNLSNGKTHSFLVQAYVNGSWSSYRDMHLASAKPSGAVKPTAKASAGSATSVKLSWNRVSGATAYAVALKTSSGYSNYTITHTGTSYNAGGLNEGSTYQFLVQAYVDGKWTSFTNADLVSFKVTDPTAPSVTAKATGDGTVSLTWGKISGATKYAVAEKLADGSYKTFTYNCADGSFTVSNLSNGKTHSFLVQAYVNGSWSSYRDMHLASAKPSGAVKPAVKVASTTSSSVALSWNKVSGATAYAVALKTSSGYSNYTITHTGISYTISGLSSGTNYQFLVQALVDGKWSAFTNADLVSVKTAGLAASSSGYAIMGTSSYTATQLSAAYKKNATYPSSVYSSKGAASIEEFCNILVAQASKEGVKAEVLFAQAMLETGWLKFGGSVKPEQCNFGGLGATSSTVSGATFSSVSEGLLAQTQHLKAYASTAALNTTCVDPRFNLVTRGSATTVEALSGKWATDTSYGSKIRSIINSLAG